MRSAWSYEMRASVLRRVSTACLSIVMSLACGADIRAQQTQPTSALAAGAQFPPGVLTTIEPAIDRADAISLHDVVEVRSNPQLRWEPSAMTSTRTLFEMANSAPFLLDVWCLELSFKPLRMIEVDVPQRSGRVQRKHIWYLVYRVRNTGVGLKPTVEPDGSFVTNEEGIEPLRFIPQFVLVSQDRDASDQRVRKAYLDRIIPTAIEPIRRRELSGGELLHSVAMAQRELPIESGRAQRGEWGVAMWEDIDPSLDFFSVYVGGLSNAHQWHDPAGAYKTGDSPGAGRQFTHKQLQLNFWRPGDAIDEDEREIRYGVAPGRADLYESGEGVAYRWVYR